MDRSFLSFDAMFLSYLFDHLLVLNYLFVILLHKILFQNPLRNLFDLLMMKGRVYSWLLIFCLEFLLNHYFDFLILRVCYNLDF